MQNNLCPYVQSNQSQTAEHSATTIHFPAWGFDSPFQKASIGLHPQQWRPEVTLKVSETHIANCQSIAVGNEITSFNSLTLKLKICVYNGTENKGMSSFF